MKKNKTWLTVNNQIWFKPIYINLVKETYMKTTKKISFEEVGKELPFGVPENYFKDFAAQINKQTGYRKPTMAFIRPWMYAAAVFAGLVAGGQLFYNNSQIKTLTAENYETYVMAQVDETSVVDYYVSEPVK